jgi:hypothetical protein
MHQTLPSQHEPEFLLVDDPHHQERHGDDLKWMLPLGKGWQHHLEQIKQLLELFDRTIIAIYYIDWYRT